MMGRKSLIVLPLFAWISLSGIFARANNLQNCTNMLGKIALVKIDFREIKTLAPGGIIGLENEAFLAGDMFPKPSLLRGMIITPQELKYILKNGISHRNSNYTVQYFSYSSQDILHYATNSERTDLYGKFSLFQKVVMVIFEVNPEVLAPGVIIPPHEGQSYPTLRPGAAISPTAIKQVYLIEALVNRKGRIHKLFD